MRKPKDALTFEALKPRLVGLGFAFYGNGANDVDPEASILDILLLAKQEPKLFPMLLTWLDKVGDLIHVERVRVLAKDLTADALVALGVVALKQMKRGDRRFSILAEFAKTRLSKEQLMNSHFAKNADTFLMEKYGVDAELLELGVKAQEIRPADSKKIHTIESILVHNPWLKFRTLIGANFRADIAYVMASKKVHNPYQAAKLVHCSQETAYRLWKGLMLYPTISSLVA